MPWHPELDAVACENRCRGISLADAVAYAVVMPVVEVDKNKGLAALLLQGAGARFFSAFPMHGETLHVEPSKRKNVTFSLRERRIF